MFILWCSVHRKFGNYGGLHKTLSYVMLDRSHESRDFIIYDGSN